MNTINRSVCVIGVLFALTLVLVAQSLPVLDPAYTGAITISGRIAPGAGPVTIYDLSYPAKTKLGESQSVDSNGNFAATIKPSLVEGHQIVAVDGKGATSSPITVIKAPASPAAGPGN